MDPLSEIRRGVSSIQLAQLASPAPRTPDHVHVATRPDPPAAATPERDPRLRPPEQLTPTLTARSFPTATVRSAYTVIDASSIDVIAPRQLTLAAVRGLSRLEPSIAAELTGETLAVSFAGESLLTLRLADDGIDTQLDALRQVVQAAASRSRRVAERSPAELTQLTVFGMKAELDQYARYFTATELAQLLGRLGVPATGQTAAAASTAPTTVRLVQRPDLPADTVIVRVTAFSEQTADELVRLLTPLVERGVTKVALDLRGTGGGIVDSAGVAADLFLANGPTLTLRARDPYYAKTATARPGSPLEGLRVALIVDGATASAAEEFAAILGDVGFAPILGVPTRAKGRAQTVVPLPSGEGLALSIGEMIGPTGAPIDEVGLMPAVCVADNGRDLPAGILAEARRSQAGRGRATFLAACASAPAQDDRAVDEALRLLGHPTAFETARVRQRSLADMPGSP